MISLGGAVEVTYGYNHGYVEPPTVGRTPILRNIFHSKWTLQEVQRFNRQPSQKIWKTQVEKKHGWHGSSKKVYINEKTQCDLNEVFLHPFRNVSSNLEILWHGEWIKVSQVPPWPCAEFPTHRSSPSGEIAAKTCGDHLAIGQRDIPT